jgi:hypothetical protein
MIVLSIPLSFLILLSSSFYDFPDSWGQKAHSLCVKSLMTMANIALFPTENEGNFFENTLALPFKSLKSEAGFRVSKTHFVEKSRFKFSHGESANPSTSCLPIDLYIEQAIPEEISEDEFNPIVSIFVSQEIILLKPMTKRSKGERWEDKFNLLHISETFLDILIDELEMFLHVCSVQLLEFVIVLFSDSVIAIVSWLFGIGVVAEVVVDVEVYHTDAGDHCVDFDQ